jgi:hypothetical protein
MAVKSKVTAVSTTAVAITLADTDITSKGWATISNTGTNTCFIGGATVTVATGFPLATGAKIDLIELKNNETLYAICASAQSAVVNALQTQV